MKKLPPDMDLFRQALDGEIKKLAPKPVAESAPASEQDEDFAALLEQTPPLPVTVATAAMARAAHLPELRLNNGAGIDRANFERLRAGEWPIDARLDLHGLTQQQALVSLQGFIAAQSQARARCLLVITGKGGKSAPDDIFATTGVLRKNFLPWLNLPALRPKILAVCTAQPRHGGAGAFYVLLKKTGAA